MGQAAIIGMGLGFISVFLIFTTFWETRKAANEGIKANRMSETLQRARLIARPEIEYVDLNTAVCVIKFENAGQTIATNCRTGFQVLDSIPDRLPEQEMGYSFTIRPREKEAMGAIQNIKNGQIFVGRTTYETIFGSNHETLYAFVIELNPRDGRYYPIPSRPVSWASDT